MNEKTKKLLIIGLAAILVLIGAIVVLEVTDDSGNSPAQTTAAEVLTTKLLYEKTPDSVKSVEVKNETDEFKIFRSGNGEYTVEGYENGYEVYDYAVKSVFDSAISITAQKTIAENVTDMSKYGLKNPSVKVKLNLADGKSMTICFGDVVPMTSTVYFCIDGENTVYSVLSSRKDTFSIIKPQLLNPTLVPTPEKLDTGKYPTVRELIVERPDLPYNMHIVYNEEMNEHQLVEPIDMALSLTAKTVVQNGLYGLTGVAAIKTDPTEKDLVTAGLDNPTGRITMKSDAGDYTVLFGLPVDGAEPGFLAMLEGGNVIYQVYASAVPWMTVDVTNITTGYIFETTLDKVDTLTVTMGGKTEKFTKSGLYSDGTAEIKRNGTSMDTAMFRDFFEFTFNAYIDDLALDAVIEEGDKPELTISMKNVDGTVETAEFYNIENSKTIIVFNGRPSYVCRTAYVETMKENMARLDSGEGIIKTW